MINAYRIGYMRYRSDGEFKKLTDFVTRHLDLIDELALFCEFSHHGYLNPEWWVELGQVLTRRVAVLKNLGVPSVGLNVLCTIGHLDEAWDVLPKPPLGTMIGHDGRGTTSNLCPNAPGYAGYITGKYRALAVSNPDFIWLDDDIRMDNHGVPYACYCPHCLEKFNKVVGGAYTRETLTAALNEPGNTEVRRAWAAFRNDTLTALCGLVGDAIHSVNPAIKTGLMTCDTGGSDFSRWMKAMDAVKGRPGGGFYHDDTPVEWVYKSLSIERQIIRYAPEVGDIQYELENFPYQRLAKSLRTLINECTGALMNGTRGTAFNALLFEDYDELMFKVREYTPLWKAMDAYAGTWRNAGMLPCFDPDYNIHRAVDGDFFSAPQVSGLSQTIRLAEIGIPLTSAEQNACGYLLAGPMVETLDDDQVRRILSRGLMMDGEALQKLISRGFGGFCGAGIDKAYDNGVMERFTGDPINRFPYEYDTMPIRNPFITFWRDDCTCYLLKPQEGARVISTMETVLEEPLGPCATLFENTLGGRVAVMGFMPWRFLLSPQKRYQMTAAADWLARGTLPLRIDRCVKVVPFVKKDPATGGMLCMLTNASLDPAGIFEVRLRTAPGARVYRLETTGAAIPMAARDNGGEQVFPVSLGPWEFIILKVEALAS